MKSIISIIDDFYPNPHQTRSEIAQLDFFKEGRYQGKDTQDVDSGNVYELIKQAFPHPIVNNYIQTNYRLSLSGDTTNIRVHTDINPDNPEPYHVFNRRYMAIVYLTKPEYCSGSLVFYKHLPSDQEQLLAKTQVPIDDYFTDSSWEETMKIPLKFNRCMIFDASFFHAPGPPYSHGTSFEDGRLIQVCYFLSPVNH